MALSPHPAYLAASGIFHVARIALTSPSLTCIPFSSPAVHLLLCKNIIVKRMSLLVISLRGMFSFMDEHEKTRAAASEALIALRRAMGKTQQTFAVEVLRTAIGTVARYETSDPPRGEVLLRLSEIAGEHKLPELASKFRLFYIEDVLQALGNQITFVPGSETVPPHGYLTTSLSGDHALRGAKDFLTILAQLRDPKLRANAISALSSLRKAAMKGKDPVARQVEDVFFGRPK